MMCVAILRVVCENLVDFAEVKWVFSTCLDNMITIYIGVCFWCFDGIISRGHFKGIEERLKNKGDKKKMRRDMGKGQGHVSMRIVEETWCIIFGNQPSQGRTLVSDSWHANCPAQPSLCKKQQNPRSDSSSAVSNTSPHPPTSQPLPSTPSNLPYLCLLSPSSPALSQHSMLYTI